MPVTPVLDLDVLVPTRQPVRLRSSMHTEGRLYEMRYSTELSMEEIARLQTISKQSEPLVKDAESLGVADARLLDDWLDEAMSIIFHTPLEPEVIAEMGCMPKWSIVQVFGEVCMGLTTPEQTEPPAKKAVKTSTGVS